MSARRKYSGSLCVGVFLLVLAPCAWAQPNILFLAGGIPTPRELCREDFTPQETLIHARVPRDYEMLNDGARMWVTWTGRKTMVSELDLATGLPMGPQEYVDSGISHTWAALFPPTLGNGPEWGFSQAGRELFYMKAAGSAGNNRELWRARLPFGQATWVTEPLPNGKGRALPWPSKDPTSPTARILFARVVQIDPPRWMVSIRERADDPTELTIPADPLVRWGGPRWMAGQDQVVFWFADETGVEQVAIYDLASGQIETITDNTDPALEIDETWSGELGNGGNYVYYLANESEVRILVDEGQGWHEVNRFSPSVLLGRSDLTYVMSPEPFLYQGRPYINFSFNATPENATPLSEIWITQPGATTGCHFRRISAGVGSNQEPEILELLTKAVGYIWRKGTIYLAETGL